MWRGSNECPFSFTAQQDALSVALIKTLTFLSSQLFPLVTNMFQDCTFTVHGRLIDSAAWYKLRLKCYVRRLSSFTSREFTIFRAHWLHKDYLKSLFVILDSCCLPGSETVILPVLALYCIFPSFCCRKTALQRSMFCTCGTTSYPNRLQRASSSSLTVMVACRL